MNTHNIIFDLDSTLVKLEGIDFLGQLHQQEMTIARLTVDAMSGKVPLEDVFKQRLRLAHPSTADIAKLAQQYLANITPGAAGLIRRIQAKGDRVFVITGSYIQAIMAVTNRLKVPKNQVFANELLFDKNGRYTGINETVPLWKTGGKQYFVRYIQKWYPGKTIVIGDGMSDYQAGQIADCFICFAGNTWRKNVIERSTVVYPYSNIGALYPLLQNIEEVLLPRKQNQKDQAKKYRHQRVFIGRVLEQTLPQLTLQHP